MIKNFVNSFGNNFFKNLTINDDYRSISAAIGAEAASEFHAGIKAVILEIILYQFDVTIVSAGKAGASHAHDYFVL